MSDPLPPEARWARQDLIPGFAEAGRHRLRDARVHVVGAGPLAGPAILYLAAAGVGTLYLDEGEEIAVFDPPGWLFPAGQVGRPRLLAAFEALAGRFPDLEVRPYATGITPSAVLIAPGAEGVAHLASERSRQSLLPQVVALGAGLGGEVISIPVGAPCLRCASGPAARMLVRGAAATAVGSLAALELMLLLAGTAPAGGRRQVLEDGRLKANATVRRDGCACARD